ncbi:MAG: hypothetical protein NTZ55_04830 [Candidatus Roizmanbacteria bacterium]|nr:hypothetical protein [Candidatus Roizmanbacteria bacterium]
MKFLPLLPELYVTNLKNSLHFYVDILQFVVEYDRSSPPFAFISYQGSQLMLKIASISMLIFSNL